MAQLKTIHALAMEYKFEYRCYWQPVIFTKQVLTPYEQAMADRSAWLRDYYLQVGSALDANPALQKDAHFRNLAHLLDARKETCFVDFMHVTETGNEAIAGAISDDLGTWQRNR